MILTTVRYCYFEIVVHQKYLFLLIIGEKVLVLNGREQFTRLAMDTLFMRKKSWRALLSSCYFQYTFPSDDTQRKILHCFKMEHPVKKIINDLRIFILDHTEPNWMFDHVHVHNEFETV